MTEEVWRTLPEFPLYEITETGDIRNRDTHKVLKEVENPKTGSFYYCLRKRGLNATTYCRNFWGLVYSAFPELDGVWADLPGYPGYQINPDGDVRHLRLRKVLPKTKSGAVIVRKDNKRFAWHITQLGDLETFWNNALNVKEAA